MPPPWPYNLLNAVFEYEKNIKNGARGIPYSPVDEDVMRGIEHALEMLSEKEGTVITERYKNEKTLEEVGNEYKITRERIRQIEKKALYKLRRPAVAIYLMYGMNGAGARTRRKALEKEEKWIRGLQGEIAFTRNKIQLEELPAIEKQKAKRIDQAGLSVRATNVLCRSGIETEYDLVRLYKKSGARGLFKLKNMGKKSLCEIMDRFSLSEYDAG